MLVGIADAGLAIVERATSIAGRARSSRARDRRSESPRRILLLRLERIGDLMMAVPAIRAVRALAPHAEIDLVVGSWNASLARTIPGISAVHTLDAPWLSRGKKARPGTLLEGARRWRSNDYDLAINFEGDIRSHALMRLSRAPRRVGFDMGGGGPLLTDRISFDPQAHTAANALRLVASAFGVSFDSLDAEWLEPARSGRRRITVPERTRSLAAQRLAGYRRPLVGVQVGGGRPIKQWPPERFGEVASALSARHDVTIVLTGSESDRALIDDARRLLPVNARVVDVTDLTDLVDVAAILQQLDVLITGDTGPMHLADAVGVPVVGIFGLTTPVRWGPLSRHSRVVRIDLPCSPCNRVRRPPERCVGIVPDCLTGISADAVVAAAVSVLSRVIPLNQT